jgi:hypothetical protein
MKPTVAWRLDELDRSLLLARWACDAPVDLNDRKIAPQHISMPKENKNATGFRGSSLNAPAIMSRCSAFSTRSCNEAGVFRKDVSGDDIRL